MPLLLRARLGTLLGLTFLGLALLRYRSDTERPILDRWSLPHAVLIVGVVGLWLLAGYGAWRGWRRRGDARVAPAAVSVDLAVCVWGLAYWLSSLDDPRAAARLWDLNFFGSATPAAVVLHCVALAALAVAVALFAFPRLAPRWRNPALSVAVVVTLLLLGETLVRLRAVIAPVTEGFPTYAGDLWARRYVRVNHLGFRDTEHELQPGQGTRHLVVVGDSYAYGAGIARTEDRFGERLGGRLTSATGARWEVLNASRPDSHTLDEIDMLQAVVAFRADVVVLVYVFNDLDYLRPVTERSLLTEQPRTIWRRVHPARVLFRNSFLFQEVYVRFRLLRRGRPTAEDAYQDSAAVAAHLADLARFVALARSAGAIVGIAPFDHTVAADPSSRRRYAAFVRQAQAAGLPVWPLDGAFTGRPLSQLRVNALDLHPNERANCLAARAAGPQVLEALGEGRGEGRQAAH